MSLKPDYVYFQPFLLDEFERFLLNGREAAFVRLVLLMTFDHHYHLRLGYPARNRQGERHDFVETEQYWAFCALCYPPVAQVDPLTVLKTLSRLHAIWTGLDLPTICQNYYWWFYGDNPEIRAGQPRKVSAGYKKLSVKNLFAWERDIPHPAPPKEDKSVENNLRTVYSRPELKLIEDAVTANPEQVLDAPIIRWQKTYPPQQILKDQRPRVWKIANARWWNQTDPVTRLYLLNHAYDLARFGYFQSQVADLSFPLPSLPDVPLPQLREITHRLANVLREAERLKEAKEDSKHYAPLEKELAKVSLPSVSLPATLPALYIRPGFISELTNACRSELESYGGVDQTVDDFIDFCKALSRPENHVREASNQYTEIQVPARLQSDMDAEMAWELRRLDNHTAYAKVLQPNGEVLVRLIKTPPPLTPHPEGVAVYQYALRRTLERYCIPHHEIEQEAIARKTAWRSLPRTETSATGPTEPQRPTPPQLSTDDPELRRLFSIFRPPNRKNPDPPTDGPANDEPPPGYT